MDINFYTVLLNWQRFHEDFYIALDKNILTKQFIDIDDFLWIFFAVRFFMESKSN